ncbi:MAG: response regulator [bacterium]
MAKKILILEDETILSELLKKKLTSEGYDVLTAMDGVEGLAKMKDSHPDLILLDIVMPKLGGIEVMEEMQKSDELKNIPVIIISNSGQPVEIDRAQRLGARDWLIKTEFDPQNVVEKVFGQIGK